VSRKIIAASIIALFLFFWFRKPSGKKSGGNTAVDIGHLGAAIYIDEGEIENFSPIGRAGAFNGEVASTSSKQFEILTENFYKWNSVSKSWTYVSTRTTDQTNNS
jgi:hypothetical protein